MTRETYQWQAVEIMQRCIIVFSKLRSYCTVGDSKGGYVWIP